MNPQTSNTETTESAERSGVAGAQSTSIVVGVDGSDNSMAALDWAMNVTPDPKTIMPLSVYRLPIGTTPLMTTAAVDSNLLKEHAERNLAEQLADTPDEVREAGRVAEGGPGPELCRVADGADLLVVGTRGRGAISSVLLGSVSDYCAKHATVPVAIIPKETSTDGPLSSAVVGVDGSDNARAALRWALRNVSLDGTVHVVSAVSNSLGPDSQYAPTVAVLDHELGKLATTAVTEAAKEVRADGRTQLPEVITTISHADARHALRQAVEDNDADALVVGARGTGGLAYLLTGSVTTALVQHPSTATVIVPLDRRR